MKELASDILILLGSVVACVGIGIACPVAGIVTAGVAMIFYGILLGRAGESGHENGGGGD